MSTQIEDLVIWGHGGFGREVAWLAETITSPRSVVTCFINDDEAAHGALVNEIPVTSLDAAASLSSSRAMVVAVGSPAVRERLVMRAADAGWHFPALLHPRIETSRWVSIGDGVIICAGCILTTNIRLGDHVHINLDCTIGHDVVLEDYVTLAPGVHVSGRVHIQRRAYVGTGATIINGSAEQPLVIGADAVVGAGACVTRSVPEGATVVGVPARSRQ
ncbi:MAG TPA: acetyltransferase [Longimicrobiales bacterium]|nr:acetyltransferase [Longimicrobiales bacterium]